MKPYKVSREAFSIKFNRVEKIAVHIPGLLPTDVVFAMVSAATGPKALEGRLLVLGASASQDLALVLVTCSMAGIETAFDRGAIELEIGVHPRLEEDTPPTQRAHDGCECGVKFTGGLHSSWCPARGGMQG